VLVVRLNAIAWSLLFPLGHVGDTLPALAWAFLLDRPTVSALDTEVYVPSAVAADAAERIAILARRGEVADSLAALGATWRVTRMFGWRLWGITELQVYEETGEAPAGPMGVDGLLARLRAQGIDRLLADPVVSARVARATGGAVATLVANGVVDNHGAAPPPWLARPVRLRARDAMLVPAEDLPDLRERLEAAGVQLHAEPLGAHALVRVLAPFASSAPCQRQGRRAVTPDSSGGDRLLLEAGLDDEALLSRLTFRHPPVPARGLRVLEVTLSRDGRAWRPVGGARVVSAWGGPAAPFSRAPTA
jgi:hypothetical protein